MLISIAQASVVSVFFHPEVWVFYFWYDCVLKHRILNEFGSSFVCERFQ